MKTLSERIKEAQDKLVASKDALLELTKALEETPDDDTVLEQVDAMTVQVEKETKHVDTLQKAEKALAERAAAQQVAGSPMINTGAFGKKEDREDLWLKEAICHFIAHCQKKTPEQVRVERFSKNKALEHVMHLKTGVALGTTFDTEFASELVEEDTQGFINLLTPLSVAAALASRGLVLNFGGFNTVRIPRRMPRLGTGANMGGAFVGEGGVIPVGRLGITSEVLGRYSMKVISTFSKELAQRATPAIQGVIRQAILDDMSVELDTAFLDSSAMVAGIRPAGIGNGSTPLAGTAGGGIDAVVADIKAGMAALTGNGLGQRPVLCINVNDQTSVGFMQTALGEFLFRQELSNGRLMNLEVVSSLNIPEHTAFMVDAAQLATAFDATEFDVNDYASVIEANADGVAPTQADDGTGELGTAGQVPRNAGIPISGPGAGLAQVGAVGRSLFQTHSVGIKAVKPCSWGFMQPNAVVHYTGLTW